jgi:hypothetical protein
VSEHVLIPRESPPIGRLALDRTLKQRERLLHMDAQQARVLHATETAKALELAEDAIDDARTALAYTRRAEK